MVVLQLPYGIMYADHKLILNCCKVVLIWLVSALTTWTERKRDFLCFLGLYFTSKAVHTVWNLCPSKLLKGCLWIRWTVSWTVCCRVDSSAHTQLCYLVSVTWFCIAKEVRIQCLTHYIKLYKDVSPKLVLLAGKANSWPKLGRLEKPFRSSCRVAKHVTKQSVFSSGDWT